MGRASKSEIRHKIYRCIYMEEEDLGYNQRYLRLCSKFGTSAEGRRFWRLVDQFPGAMYRLLRDLRRVNYDSLESLQGFTCSGLIETMTLSVHFLKLSREMEGENERVSVPLLPVTNFSLNTARLITHLATSVDMICTNMPRSNCLSLRAIQDTPHLTENSFQLLRHVVVSFLSLASAVHRSGSGPYISLRDL